MIKKSCIVLFFLSLLYPLNKSRISTTFDSPGEYSVPIHTIDGTLLSKNTFKTDFSIDVAYEHLIVDGNDFLLCVGAEFMVGRKSSSNISLHSAYLMPMLKLSDKLRGFLKFGGAFLNTSQLNFFVDKGLMFSAGLEYTISDHISIAFSGTGYDLFNETYNSPDVSSIPFTQLGIGSNVSIPAVDIDLKYTKFGLSVIYGF